MTAIIKTEAELRQSRDTLIAELPAGMTEAVLFERGRAFELYPEDQRVYDTLVSIYYLLGEPEPEPSRPSSE